MTTSVSSPASIEATLDAPAASTNPASLSGPSSSPEPHGTADAASSHGALSPEQAFEQMKAAIAALPEEQIRHMNADIPRVVSRAIGALPKVASIWSRVATELPTIDPHLCDTVRVSALATFHAHFLYQATQQTLEQLAGLSEQVGQRRAILAAEATTLVLRKALDPQKVAAFTGQTGYRTVGSELAGLATVLKQNWASIQGKTSLSLAELDGDIGLGMKLLVAAGEREQARNVAADAAVVRARAFTLFFDAYDTLRKVVGYLRWESDDAEDFAPSLYAQRARKKQEEPQGSTEDARPASPATPASPAAPAPAGGTSGSASAPAAFGGSGGSPFL